MPICAACPLRQSDMLKELNIRNIALIDSLRIEFTRGLNALTGETGTGKSIVVDCVNLALGQRAAREMVRTGEEKGSVRALFDLSCAPQAKAFLDEAQIDYDDDYAEISRELSQNGRSVCRINGCAVPLNTLKSFSQLLVDLHGQQEHQKLMDTAQHRVYLDGFAGSGALEALIALKSAYEKALEARRALKKLESDEKTLAQKADILSMQLKEITSAKLKEGEDEELERRCKLYENAERLNSSMRTAYERLYLGGKQLSAQESLRRALDAVNAVAELDGQYAALASRIEELLYAVKDVGYEVQSIYEEMSFDPSELERMQDRLEVIKKLKRKYGPELADVMEFAQKAQSELESLENIESRREEARQESGRAEEALKERAKELSRIRQSAAGDLEKRVMEQLKDLGMERTRFEVRFSRRETIGPEGAEDVEFMISPNPGEPLRPLAQIASGGEISRFMLALKVILAASDGIQTMIFDEIDTGISGRMAQIVGEKMSVLGADRQVICVTHLAQIAALADTQFVVEKRVANEKTTSTVLRLDDEGRLKEIARLVGGADTLDSGLTHARRMLDSAKARTKELRSAL